MRRQKVTSYAEDWSAEDDDIEGPRLWSLEEKLSSTVFDFNFVKRFANGEGFNLEYVQENGFRKPMIFLDRVGLGLRMPSAQFSVTDVRQCVGASRPVDVMDVNTQKALVLSMREFERYYLSPQRERLLNVISLEFSHTKLDNYVEAPLVVRQIDWVERAWPRYLMRRQTDGLNRMETMHYPKVRKYVLMSVAGCYTDFHIDFGGTSVWYHILRGAKIFWLIPPTERNLLKFEQWVKDGNQNDRFFGDLVDKCQRVELSQGQTFLIPTGWIHAVYTPEDSLVFGANFLHSFNVSLQLRIWNTEDKTHVSKKFRFPMYTELHWYVLARFGYCLMHLDYVTQLPPKTEPGSAPSDETVVAPVTPPPLPPPPVQTSDEWVHLTPFELEGITCVVAWLRRLPPTKRCVPADVLQPERLLADIEQMLSLHQGDDLDLAITNRPVLSWPKCELDENQKCGLGGTGARRGRGGGGGRGSRGGRGGGAAALAARRREFGEGPTRRRVRCKVCEPCRRQDCADCCFCRDMVRFGGNGIMKQCCVQKQCLQPQLPLAAECFLCHVAPLPEADVAAAQLCLGAVDGVNGNGAVPDSLTPEQLIDAKLKAKQEQDDAEAALMKGDADAAQEEDDAEAALMKGDAAAAQEGDAAAAPDGDADAVQECNTDAAQECNTDAAHKKGDADATQEGDAQKASVVEAKELPVLDALAELRLWFGGHEEADEDGLPRRWVMECGVCWRIEHPGCLARAEPTLPRGHKVDTMPNTWCCPRCVAAGRLDLMPSRVPKGLLMLQRLERQAANADGGDGGGRRPRKRRRSSDGDAKRSWENESASEPTSGAAAETVPEGEAVMPPPQALTTRPSRLKPAIPVAKEEEKHLQEEECRQEGEERRQEVEEADKEVKVVSRPPLKKSITSVNCSAVGVLPAVIASELAAREATLVIHSTRHREIKKPRRFIDGGADADR